MRTPLALALATVLTLAACGQDSDDDPGDATTSGEDTSSYADNSVEEIVADASAAMGELTSLRMTGSIDEDGQELDMDLALATDGTCDGSVGVGGTGTLQVRVVDGEGFFKADEEFWTSQAGAQADQIIQAVGDRWVVANGGAAEVVSVCDLDDFLSEFEGEEMGNPGEVVGIEQLDGEDVVAVTFTSDDGNDGTAYVRTAEPHFLVKMEIEGEGEMVLGDFDEPVEPEKPSGDDVIDLTQLG